MWMMNIDDDKLHSRFVKNRFPTLLLHYPNLFTQLRSQFQTTLVTGTIKRVFQSWMELREEQVTRGYLLLVHWEHVINEHGKHIPINRRINLFFPELIKEHSIVSLLFMGCCFRFGSNTFGCSKIDLMWNRSCISCLASRNNTYSLFTFHRRSITSASKTAFTRKTHDNNFVVAVLALWTKNMCLKVSNRVFFSVVVGWFISLCVSRRKAPHGGGVQIDKCHHGILRSFCRSFCSFLRLENTVGQKTYGTGKGKK